MAESNIWKGLEEHTLSGFTLIIPSVAVGNVAQLACDLLISSLDMKKIGSVYSRAFIPVIGYDPYNLISNEISSCCEIYKSSVKKIVVLQLRAPLLYKYARSFLEQVVRKFKEKSVKDIIIMTSSSAHEKKYIQTSAFRHIANEKCIYRDKINSLKWLQHVTEEPNLKIYGGGFAALLYKITVENSVPSLVLYKYCSEGDNIPDAYEMISYLSQIVELFNQESDLFLQLVQPISWKLLFGRPPPQDIY